MKKTIILFLMTVMSVAAVSAQKYTAAQVRHRFTAVARKVSTMQCDFVQTRVSKMLEGKSVSKGRMSYGKPDKLRWEYTSPYHYTVIFDGKTVTMGSGNRMSHMDVSQSAAFKNVTRIISGSIMGTYLSSNRDFKVSLKGKGNSWQAVMVPQRDPMRKMYKTITAYLDMKTATVSGLRMVEKNGDVSTIELSNIQLK